MVSASPLGILAESVRVGVAALEPAPELSLHAWLHDETDGRRLEDTSITARRR